jgi:uncharacterized protein YqjF (DUF2071 family)/predicted DCC family thiol-disulfide oxidoreductase YuxK
MTLHLYLPYTRQMPTPFLTASWSNLIFINYEVDPAVLTPLLPLGTELDLFEGKALVSLIAFNFENNKLFGVIPTYPVTKFEEVNLRFYVKRRHGEDLRRGVVFVKEIVPSVLIASTARLLYNEPYEARPMMRSLEQFNDKDGGRLSYGVRVGTRDVTISATTVGELQPMRENSIEQFILEHYWGYTNQPDGTTSEYRVVHEQWKFWSTFSTATDGDFTALYPSAFKSFLEQAPHSAFVARGSSVAVYAYNRFRPTCDMSHVPRKEPQGYVLYDGTCGLCSWWVPRLKNVLQKAGFAIAPLQAEWVQKTIPLAPERLTDDIRLLASDGTLVSGADAYIHVVKQMRVIRPLGVLLGLPGLRYVTRTIYALVKKNRFAISKMCKLRAEIS